MGILIPLVLIFFTCLLIWRACDSFEIASEYIGRNLSEGVRGGTINAISSSVPELFTTLIALFVLSDRDGFSVGIGTTAGSALFNGMIIPAACILSVVGAVILGVRVTSVNVSTKVLLRDGLSLIFCEIILILLINGSQLHWWQGVILMGLYGTYLAFMLLSMKRSAASDDAPQGEDLEDADDAAATERGIFSQLFYWLSLGPLMDMERVFVREKHRQQIDEETWNGWPLLLTSTTVIGGACWLLVKACEWLGTGSVEHPAYTLFGYELQGIGMPAMFVAVIFASMATSVPDTVMSIRDARDGDYDDAVANALGSNIFDICFALGFPLFLFTALNGPIEMSPEIVSQSGELRLLLLVLTIVGFFVYYLGKRGVTEAGTQYVEMRRGKAFILLGIYVLFVFYIVARSQEMTWALEWSEWLQSLLQWLPAIG
ncbi:putative calcium/sodium:proton antiporter [Novipirellula galeiformis]|uniref:Putative calcium/sodium:proton antiporter n=1 Tax=Novipirellula galeiformis TaxID=2528004 RepID=A0A5C6CAN6_9BACT|nr:sodium:calcium antiporter [Novipirellula galeiformis]TWU21650.1 putative calcium/sodium:proton antiporter [Novipirellula galeiformis]